MSLVDWLLNSRTPLRLAQELAAHAKENAALRNRVGELEHELFWTKVRQRDLDKLDPK
jgi:hypothetical protein